MSYSAVVASDSPLAYLRLGDASGSTAVDASGNSHPGAYVGSPTLGVAGLLTGDADTAVTFNGSTQYVSIDNSTGWADLTSFTAEIWFKGSGTSQAFCGHYDSTTANHKWHVGLTSTGKVQLTMYNSTGGTGTNYASAASFNDGNRHQCVVVKSGTSITVYVDGTQVASGTQSSYNAQANVTLYVGQRGASSQLFNGTLDEFAYYGTPLSGTRVAAHYTAGTSATVQLGVATETDTAPAAGKLETLNLGAAVETDSAPSLTIGGIQLGVAVETDSAPAVELLSSLNLGIAIETETAPPLAPPTLFCDWGGLDVEIDPGSRSLTATLTCDWGGMDVQAQAVVYDHGSNPPKFVPAAIALYSPDNEWLANFPTAVGVAFRDALLGSGAGYVTCQIPLDAPHYDLIAPNTILKAIYRGRARAAAPVKQSTITVNTSTEGRQFRAFDQLPDLLTVALGSMPIFPEWELNRASSQSRMFGYASRKRSAWGNWTFAQGVPWTDETGIKKGLPRGLNPKLNPWWVAKDGSHADKPPGYKEFFWRAFTTYQEMTFELGATGDNHLTLYLDGEQIFTPDLQQGMTWRHLGVVPAITIPAGRHVAAGLVANIRTLIKVHPDSPVALLFLLRQLDNKGNPLKGDPFLISDEKWLVSSDYPGFHGGEIVRMLWDEAIDNGFAWAQRLGISFSLHRDSHGHLWDDDVQERIFDVGSPLLDAAQALTESAFDMCLDAQTCTVQGFNRAGADLSATVGFKFGSVADLDEPNPALRGSIREWSCTRIEPTTNAALIQLANGSYAEKVQAASASTYGKEGTGLSLGSTAQDDTATEVANAQFAETATPSFTYTLQASTLAGPQPYDSYASGGVHKGDSVSVPDFTMAATDKARITAFVYDQSDPDAGEPTVTVELVTDPT